MNERLRKGLQDIILERIDLEASINWMTDNGQSLTLNWADDNELWEVAWIFEGKRYCGFSKSPREAIIKAVSLCMDAVQRSLSND